jgi:hypothetical protein
MAVVARCFVFMKTEIRKVSDANRSMEKAVPASPFPKNDCRNDPEKTDETTPQTAMAHTIATMGFFGMGSVFARSE